MSTETKAALKKAQQAVALAMKLYRKATKEHALDEARIAQERRGFSGGEVRCFPDAPTEPWTVRKLKADGQYILRRGDEATDVVDADWIAANTIPDPQM